LAAVFEARGRGVCELLAGLFGRRGGGRRRRGARANASGCGSIEERSAGRNAIDRVRMWL
jgi:hypothetical protein